MTIAGAAIAIAATTANGADTETIDEIKNNICANKYWKSFNFIRNFAINTPGTQCLLFKYQIIIAKIINKLDNIV